MFFGKTNSGGLLTQNWAKFSCGTILPPNVPYSQLGPEKRYGTSFIKKFIPKTCFFGWTKLRSGTLLPPIAPSSPLGQGKRYGASFINEFQQKTCFFGWTKLRSGTLLPPIAPSSPFGQGNRWGAIYYKNSNRKRVFWKNEFERAFEAKLSKVFVRNNFAPERTM